MYAFVLALQGAGLTFRDVVSEIPRDAGAMVAYLVLAGIVFFTWYGSRKSTIDRYSVPYTPELGEAGGAASEAGAAGGEATEPQSAARSGRAPLPSSRPCAPRKARVARAVGPGADSVGGT